MSNLLVAGFFLAVFLSCFASVLVADYGYQDDYHIVVAHGPHDKLGSAGIVRAMRDGRPLHALLRVLYLQGVTEIEHLRYLRLVGVLGIALLAWCVFHALARAGWSRFHSACVAVIMCASLPFQVIATWAECAPYPLAAVASGLAFLLGERAFETPRRRSKWLLATGAGLALLAALTLYQPAAMFFWVFAAVSLLKPDTAPRDMLRRFGWYCVIGFAGMLAGFAVFELIQATDFGRAFRTGLVRDGSTKIVWFLSIFLPNALNFVLLSPSWLLLPEAEGDLSIRLYHEMSHFLDLLNISLLPSIEHSGTTFSHALAFSSASGGLSFVHKILDTLIAWGVFACIGGGLWLYFRGARGDRLWKCGVAASLLLLSSIPNLAVGEHNSAYRTMPAPASLIVLLAYFAFQGYGGRQGRPVSPVRARAVLGAAAVACALSAAWHVRTYLVAPQAQELALMRSQLERADLSRIRGIHVIRPPRWQRNAPAPLVWREFGSTSSAYGSFARSMAFLLLRELAPEHAGLPIELADFNDATTPPADALVVDMRRTGRPAP